MSTLSYTESDGRTALWRDRKRYLWLLALIPSSATFIAWGMVWLTSWNVFWWAGPIIAFVIIPIIDVLAGEDGKNPPDEVIDALENDRYYRWCTYAYIPLQYSSFVLACYVWANWDLSVLSNIGLAVTVGVTAGIGINTAHELGHKKENVERWLSKIVLAQSAYGHFYIEHNRGHHVRVSTPEDPASSRFGETFYRFWPRSVVGGVRSAWHLEKARFERLGTTHWSIRNDVLNAWLMTLVLFAAVFAVFGIGIWPYVLIQAVIGFSLLEGINYLEHYGLRRQKTASGRYERCTPAHSWNSDRLCTNVFLYHLQRHSDHHANPTRRYQTLRSMDQAPQLPGGYASMILLATVPPLWRTVMDHRVLDHYDGDITRVNVQPGKQEKIYARYGATVDGGAA
ncbi:alkane 1-monooxygenase [Rhodococcus triatomae]|uniref:Alkane 1-monooxygenase n=3 Tax=Rhodococcus triatomae TaxID=300028 RepID=A0A1G8P0C1_9NOCA|nr:alkane 1-monooxygenase [Rhodococcus triatomae]QNG18787.1 alkane 1-monooxygenase [Rhodococcus triatomae]QNG25302.1 alkane 1-monooxygenase [Rhodococcus triatomae]SDI85775.1 alkane 1-monooxygenase [Rhodococcus triatomae]